MNLQQLSKEIHALAVEKGWHETPRSFAETRILVVSEISEALEEYRDSANRPERMRVWISDTYKPEGFPVEVADIAIRCLDYLGSRDVSLPDFDANLPVQKIDFPAALDDICECLYLYEENDDAVFQCAVAALTLLAEMGFDPEDTISIKHAYNKTRPFRHGGKTA